jgi:hypothetical protein
MQFTLATTRTSWPRLIRKWMILTHRWMGVGFCVLFLAWFVSGLVMIYCRFPRVEAEDRLSREGALDPSRVQVEPDRALASLHLPGPPSQIRLNLLDGRPVYRFAFERRTRLVFADNGQRLEAIPQEMALRTAAAWTRFPAAAARFQGLITKTDQWTVYSSVHPYGPFWKYSWPNGEETYVSRSTGEVVQDTTRASRIGAYFGAIPHWLYFTWLRTNSSVWTQVVIWLSGAGTLMSILGLAVGVWMYSPSKRYRFPAGETSIPYTGQKRWHMVLGLIFGLFACTWVFSGLLSMGPFSWLSDPERPNLERALRGDRIKIASFATKSAAQAIVEVASVLTVKELEYASFDGTAFYLAIQEPRRLRIVPMAGDPCETLATGRILEAVQRAVSPAAIAQTRVVEEYEPYYVDRQNRRPLPAIYVELNDAARSAYYLDPKTGRVVESYGARSRWNRWLYHGLHSMDLPWLYARRPAWDILVIALLLGGTALCITSLLLAWKLIRRKLSARREMPEAEQLVAS